MSLLDLGWAPFFARSFDSFLETLASPGASPPPLEPARVAAPGRGLYRLATADRVLTASLPGRLRAAGGIPAVGDWVAVAAPASAGGRAVIRGVLPRRTAISRKVAGPRSQEQVLAANVDTVLLVLGLDGDFNLRRLERLVATAAASGAEAAVLLTKADLAGDLPGRRLAAEAVAPGLPVHAVSAVAPGGLAELQPYLAPGRTLVLLGSSGVGKSTLVNRLAGREILRTAPVRPGDDRGRHTTTHRELFRLPGGALVIDGPGLREVQLWGGAEEALPAAFADIEELARGCRFRDCRHRDEPGCAVRRAVEEGRLDGGRLESQRALERELAYLERRRDAPEARRRERRQGAEYKRIQRAKEERGRR
jgi:ribosome biogenesis GTPase